MQDMNEETQVSRGNRAEELIRSQTFQDALNDIQQFCIQAFLTSRYDDEKTREAAYYQASSVQQVKDLLNSWVAVKEQIIASNDQSVED